MLTAWGSTLEPCRFEPYLLGANGEDSKSESETVTFRHSDSSIGSSSSSGGDPDTLSFKMQTTENLMQYRPTLSCVVQCIARDCSGVVLIHLC